MNTTEGVAMFSPRFRKKIAGAIISVANLPKKYLFSRDSSERSAEVQEILQGMGLCLKCKGHLPCGCNGKVDELYVAAIAVHDMRKKE